MGWVLHFATREIRVARVNEPLGRPARDANRDGGMASRVPDERDEHHVVGDDAHAAKPLPRIPRIFVKHPLRSVREVRAAVTSPLVQRPRSHRRFVLAAMDVDFGIRKVGQPAGVIDVEVRHDEVAHVLRLEAERCDLPERRTLREKLRTEPSQKDRTEATDRVAQIRVADAGVDQHEAVACGLDQERVRDDVRCRAQ